MGWLALLLTAGVALAPSGVRGQEVPPPDPQFPIPTGRPDKSGFYTGIEFVFFRQTNPLKHQTIAFRGLLDFDGSITADLNGTVVTPIGAPTQIVPGQPVVGNFLGSHAPALDAQQASGPISYQPGFRLTAGWRFQDQSAIEFSWMTLTEAKYSAVATLVPPGLQAGPLLTETFLFSPVFNFPNDFAGPPLKIALGNPLAAFGIWNGASVMSISFTQRLSQYDLNGRIPIFDTDYCRCYGILGVRHISLWERFNWRTVSEDFSGAAGQDDVALYNNIVSNQMYGFDVGCGSEWYIAHGFAATLDVSAAGMVDFVHEIAKYYRADFFIGNKRAKREYKLVPEVEAKVAVYWYPIEGVELRCGYDLMALFNTVAAATPVSFNYGGLDPPYQQSYRLIDGVFGGIAFIF
jgi:hypothetical protein